jgi:hypothetical protein
MLVWFALSIGVAVAAPVVNPQALTLVCTTAGVVKLVSGSDDTGTQPMVHALDCVLCLSAGAPPSVFPGAVSPETPPAVRPMAAFRHFTPQDADPASARGPPALV